MSYMCEITGKKRLRGHRVSHANNKSIHFQRPNLRDKRMFIPELGITVSIRVSSAGMRTIDKHGGLARHILSAKPETLSPNLLKIKKLLGNKKSAKKKA
jgi:large subunit ribosomal protein L28